MHAAFQRVLVLTNTARQQVGALPLQLSPILMQSAQKQADEMACYDYIDHVDRQGGVVGDRLQALGYIFRFAGENLSVGLQSPNEIMAGWLQSAGHRANILKPEFTVMGLGYAYRVDGCYQHYWVQVFASPLF
ncbi:Cysteine-rich secretory protein family [Beggiatoa alba B18LD]|uniref:Cysteine-rich secretory protein family n=1 Tax=Beggiatoa alba B18LD TaxID=395493 RepID=I3CBS8_9GAMM|nr:CAP domain-containing protein [Beggiatoa alba]EIJ41071.1 Cysteine-rich secretory protein family [Beggiatoa alba B18LD]